MAASICVKFAKPKSLRFVHFLCIDDCHFFLNIEMADGLDHKNKKQIRTLGCVLSVQISTFKLTTWTTSSKCSAGAWDWYSTFKARVRPSMHAAPKHLWMIACSLFLRLALAVQVRFYWYYLVLSFIIDLASFWFFLWLRFLFLQCRHTIQRHILLAAFRFVDAKESLFASVLHREFVHPSRCMCALETWRSSLLLRSRTAKSFVKSILHFGKAELGRVMWISASSSGFTSFKL